MKQQSFGNISAGVQGEPDSNVGQIGNLLTAGARDWNWSPATILFIWAVPAIVLIASAISALLGKAAFKWFLDENGFVESLQVVFYLIAFVTCLLILRQLWQSSEKTIAALYVIAATGLFFLIGEEISWGQHFFGWTTPEPLEAINKQHETNIHNIYGIGETFKWIQLMVGAYGTILPLLVMRGNLSGRLKELASFLVPHYTLIPLFAPMFLWKIFRNFFEVPRRFYFGVTLLNEAFELILAVGFACFMAYQWKRLKARQR